MPKINCPICKKTFDSEQSTSMPFCSERCKQIDLGRWLDERYGLVYDRMEEEEEPGQEEI
jgi:uncharacterized protein